MVQPNNDKWRICRICLSGEVRRLYSLRLSDHASIRALDDFEDNIISCIEEIGNIKIDLVSHMPDKMCRRCLLLLKGAYKFRELCLRSDKRLKEVLQINKPFIRALENYTDQASPETRHEEECKQFICMEEETDFVCDKQEVVYQVETLAESTDLENVEQYELVEEFDDLNTEYFSSIQHLEEKSCPNDGIPPEDGIPLQIEPIEEELHEVQMQKLNAPAAHNSKENVKTTTYKKRKTETITKIVNYVCSYCGNIYNEKSKLTMHLKLHTNEKPHECEICGKRFSMTPQLARHMNSHTGKRPFKCQYCEASFADPSTKIKHERIHTNERPYKCKVCGKSFAYSNVLKVHMITHTGEKPYRLVLPKIFDNI
uniref:Uncharacterized protein n=1 Tax=Glossina morsitans morsitans TaxID=37546 RepID=A0A1B0GGC7_GLOMM